MAFFKLFPKVGYDLNNNGVLQNIVNIYRSVRPLKEFLDDYSAYKMLELLNEQCKFLRKTIIPSFFLFITLRTSLNVLL